MMEIRHPLAMALGWLLFLHILLAGSPAHAADTQVPVYSPFELNLTASGSYANPYLQMPADNTSSGFVTATFSGPSGESITVDGFWDGGDSWKVRMAPLSEGTWTYSTSSSDPGLDGKSGSFSAVTAVTRGFVRVDPDNPHHFVWSDGSPFVLASTAMMISNFDPRDAIGGSRTVDNGSFQSLADIRAEQGFNATFWGYYGLNKPQFNEQSQVNEGGAPFTDFDASRLNPAYYQAGDLRVQALALRGIASMFTLGWPDQGIASNPGHAALKRYWRYLIARYSAYNVIWNLFGEAQEFGSGYLSTVNDYAALTRAHDPYDHLLSTHTVYGSLDSQLLGQSWMDFIILQQDASATSGFLQYNKPVINAEYGAYEGYHTDGNGVRQLTWAVYMQGGYPVYEAWVNDPQSSGAVYSGIASRFFRDHTSFNELEYMPSLFGGAPGLASPGSEYVVYLGSGGTVSVNLSALAGEATASWFDPRSGSYSGSETVAGGASRSFTAPDGADWVLHITGSGPVQNNPPPSAPTNLQVQ